MKIVFSYTFFTLSSPLQNLQTKLITSLSKMFSTLLTFPTIYGNKNVIYCKIHIAIKEVIMCNWWNVINSMLDCKVFSSRNYIQRTWQNSRCIGHISNSVFSLWANLDSWARKRVEKSWGHLGIWKYVVSGWWEWKEEGNYAGKEDSYNRRQTSSISNIQFRWGTLSFFLCACEIFIF